MSILCQLFTEAVRLCLVLANTSTLTYVKDGGGRELTFEIIITFLRQAPVWGRNVTLLHFSKLSFLFSNNSCNLNVSK